MAINIKSYNQILGEMVRKIIADTPLNDVNTGSALLSLLEAAAQTDFENNASILNVLELLSIDAVRNNDLDVRGADFGLTRRAARKATGFVTIKDSTISKRSTGLYQVKPAPIAGSTQIFVNDASAWSPTGNLFLGRGTPNFEGPIAYTSIINNGSFFTIVLGSALQKDHLISDVVVDAQGTTDRFIGAGTTVQIPANNQNPVIEYTTLRDAVIPAGEDTVDKVDIVAVVAGARSNAGIGTITQFSTVPFTGATVSNSTALTNGADVESDNDFRERIKSYASTLARGTQPAIISAILGISDPDDSKQVDSAVVTEPPKIGDPSIIYIDDGSGFQPSFAGQSVDRLLSSASGNEEFLQLANFPLPRPQVINTAEGPYQLAEGMQLSILVDGVEEAITFSASQFTNISAATLAEIIIAINDQSTTFKATFTSNSSRILLFPVNHAAETLQVTAKKAGESDAEYANSVLKFPTNEFSYIRLYQNNTLLNEQDKAATLLTTSFATWNITTSGNIIISVDGTPPQDRNFTTSDFGGSPFASLSLSDWVEAFNKKFAGITATATSSGKLQMVSNKEGSESSLEIVGGTYFDKWFSNEPIFSQGQNSDFQLNRQTGNLRILTEIEPGDSIQAGTEDAKGNNISSTTLTGNFNVSTDSNSRPAEMVVVADSDDVVPRIGVGLAVGNVLTVTDQGNNTMRIMSDSASSFDAVQPHDYLYITSRGNLSPWINPANCGLFKIIAKGEHTNPGVDTYIEVKNFGIVPGVHTVAASEDIQAFKAMTYPQIWKGAFTATPASASIQEIVDTINDNLVNVKSSIFKTNAIKLTTTTEDNGSIAIPVSVGRAALLFASQGEEQKGNPSHIANRVADQDIVSMFKRTEPTSTDADGVTGKIVWLDRVTYTDIKGTLTSNAAPGVDGVDTYSEELQATGDLTDANVDYDDIYNMTLGANKGHYRSIRDKLAGDRIGTQHALPVTLMDHVVGDTFNLMRSTAISSEDSIVFILDQDPVAKTIDIPMSRTGRVNTAFPTTDISFSADDADNEPGITFGNLQVWGKTANKTEFKDYAVWMRARNWYVSGGAGSGGGSFIIRSKEYGPHGENLRFKIEYPSFPSQESIITHSNDPDFSQITYFFGSDPAKNINMTPGETFTVTSLGSDNFRYTFPGVGINLATVVVGDIVSILNDSGVTAANRGQFRINNVNPLLKYIDIHNPDGAATGVGSPEVSSVTTIADVIGSKTVSVISSVAAAAGLDGTWFQLNDSAGSVAVYYNVGTPNPGAIALGVNRVIEVGPLTGAESAATVTALTAGTIDADPQFTASYLGTTVTATNAENGANPVATDGTTPTGFGFAGTLGDAAVSLTGKYFIIPDAAGSVAIWYDVTGTTPEPLHGASRSIRVATVAAGDSASTVATKTAVVIAGDGAWASATVLSNVITVTDAANGARSGQSAGTSGFTVAQVTNGVDTGIETVVVATSFMVFPLIGKAVTDITSKISESPLVNAVVLDGTNDIEYATRDEVYTPAGPGDYSASLAYGHDPDPSSNLNEFISFYDGISWVKEFDNLNPNFTLKRATTLQGEAPLAYSMDSCPNPDTADLGEFFKLVPVTLNNVYHHFTQKALSQLPIVANVDISNNIRRIQIKSKLLGSQGSVEVVGGNANGVAYSIFGEAQVAPGISKDFLEVKTAAFPVSLTKGDLVLVENTQSAKRFSRLSATDTIDVFKGSGDDLEYRYNAKTTNTNQYVRFTISDVSASYLRPSGTVWRWTHNDGGSLFEITGLANGLPSVMPDDEIAAGGTDSANLDTIVLEPGSVTTPIKFRLAVSTMPTQADYFTFRSAAGVTFAVWFDIDAAGIAPTGATYIAATNKIEVDILSTDTEDQIVSKLATQLLGDVNFLSSFSGAQIQGATFSEVKAGDLLNVYGTFSGSWSTGNKANASGDGNVAGFPIIAVNASSSYIDVVNPDGVAMTNQAIGTGTVEVVPTPIINWKLKHASKTGVVQIVLAAPFGTATVTTELQHRLKEGDSFVLEDNGLAQTATVVSVPSSTSFTFTDTTGLPAATYPKGNVRASAKTVTRYKIESLGFNHLFRLSYVDGDAPGFIDCGVAVDDILVIGGSTFKSNNSGKFRILAVDNSSLVYQNEIGVEELDTVVPFNNLETPVIWVSNSDTITGSVGAFKNVSVGDWVKKEEDDEDLYKQVISLLDGSNIPTTPALAVKAILGDNYQGTSSTSTGVAHDQNSDVDTGVYLSDMGDVAVVEGDAVQVGDSLFVDRIANTGWFSTVNSGTFEIVQFGTVGADYRPFLRVKNAAGASQTDRDLGVSLLGFFIIEGENNTYSSIRKVEHLAIDSFDENKRSVYMTPATKVDKMSQAYGTKLTAVSKIGYDSGVTTGIDGYTYYTGLLRTVQRIVDGFEPDPVSYPGRRAVGGIIEILPPLIKRVKVSIEVTTNEGVNLNEITNDIKSAIINYIDDLGVGEDVILSEMIVRVMNITGVAAVTFNVPAASTERISVSDNEKAFIEPNDISVA